MATINFLTPRANAAQADSTQANRDARGAHDVKITAGTFANGLVDFADFVGGASSVRLGGDAVLHGYVFQYAMGNLVDDCSAQLGARCALAVFVLPAYAERVVPPLLEECKTLELMDPPRARGVAHLVAMLKRAKRAALNSGRLAANFFRLGDAEGLHIPDLATRVASAAHFTASANPFDPPAVDSSPLASLRLVDAIQRGIYPTLLWFADERMARAPTDSGGALHLTLAMLQAGVGVHAGLGGAATFQDLGDGAEASDYIVEALAAATLAPEYARPAGLAMRRNKLKRCFDSAARAAVMAAHLYEAVGCMPTLARGLERLGPNEHERLVSIISDLNAAFKITSPPADGWMGAAPLRRQPGVRPHGDAPCRDMRAHARSHGPRGGWGGSLAMPRAGREPRHGRSLVHDELYVRARSGQGG